MAEIFTGYVTSYALTSGIMKVQLKETSTPGMVEQVGAAFATYFHGKEWWRIREDAVKQAEEMRQKKIKSLSKSIAKLESLTFEANNG